MKIEEIEKRFWHPSVAAYTELTRYSREAPFLKLTAISVGAKQSGQREPLVLVLVLVLVLES
jgi:hypothetical protein